MRFKRTKWLGLVLALSLLLVPSWSIAGPPSALTNAWGIPLNLGDITVDSLALTSALTVADGGTGASSLTDHGVLVGSGTGAITPLAVGTTGQVLVGATGADPAWASNLTMPGWLNMGGNIIYGSAAANGDFDIRATSDGTTTTSYIMMGTNGQGRHYFISQEFNSGFDDTADNAGIYLNYHGYQGGSTKFRDFIVGNGKGSALSTWDGSAARLTHAVDVLMAAGKRLRLGVVTDAGPMTATNGTQGDVVFNTSDSKAYVCTVTGTPATWAALN